MKTTFRLTVLIPSFFLASGAIAEKPLMKDFMGINGHFHFKGDTYAPTCSLVRNYHNLDWDVRKPGDAMTFPVCVNKVNWKTNVYGKWKTHGFETALCAMFGSFGESNKGYRQLWQGKEKWCFDYGRAMAGYFGPSGKEKLITSIEIGNEPGNDFDDTLYQSIFRSMARGIRAGDPKVKIVTCTAHARGADKYSKDLRETFQDPGMVELFDVINIHSYAQIDRDKGKNPWTRTYPEGEDTPYLTVIEEAVQWRNKHALGKEIWLTEFGYDACTPDMLARRTGWFKKLDWRGVTDEQQAQYLVRSFLIFSAMDIDRAYLYFYDDKNQPHVHGAAGLTRNGTPKMSFHAVQQLYATLGDYRFNRAVEKTKALYLYEFKRDKDLNDLIWTAWSPTGNRTDGDPNYRGRASLVTLKNLPGKVQKVFAMQRAREPPPTVTWKALGPSSLELTVSESPVYLFFKK